MAANEGLSVKSPLASRPGNELRVCKPSDSGFKNGNTDLDLGGGDDLAAVILAFVVGHRADLVIV
jgi:hypothetical protein